MPSLSTGVDIASISRFLALSTKPAFLEKVFTEKERARTGPESSYARTLAGFFAAKEAVMKALGSGWGGKIGWKDIEVSTRGVRHEATLHGGALELLGERRLLISVSCTRDVAAAMAVVE